MRRRATRRSALLIVIAMIGGLLAATMGTATAFPPTSVSASQTSNLLQGQFVTVTIVADTTVAGHFYAVTQCGNADTAGNSIAPGDQKDCAATTSSDGSGGLQITSNGGSTFPASLGGGLTAGQTYTATIAMLKTNIGLNAAQCVPVDAQHPNPCTINIAEADATQANFGATAINVTYRPPATVAIGTITGQNGNQAAREGNTLNVSGINWDNNAVVTAQLCSSANLASCDAAIPGATVSGSNLSGSLVVPVGATTGTRALKITDGVQTATTSVQILGARSVSLAPAAGGIGTGVAVSGAGFDATQAVTIVGLTAGLTPVAALPVTATSSAVGAVNATYTISDPLTRFIAVSENDNPTTEAALSPFAFSGNDCTVPTGGNCSVLQTVTLNVIPGALTLAQTGGQVAMSSITLNGTQQTSTGAVNALTVTDARGSLAGWSVTATMTNLTGPGGTNSTINAGNMTVTTPACAPSGLTTGSSVGITAGAAGQAFDPVAALTLCTATAGQGGGTYGATAGLSLIVPANVRSGTYTSTITILLA